LKKLFLTVITLAMTFANGQNVIAIVGGTVIDGNGGPPIRNGVIIIQDNKISEIGRKSSIKIPSKAKIIKATGKYVTPGFIDSNVHLSLYGRGETIVRYEHKNESITLEAAQLQLKHGFTTVRDSYGSLLPLMHIRDAIARGDTIGPRILVAGNIVGWGGPYSISFSLIREKDLTIFQEQFNDFITQGSGEELMDMGPNELKIAINNYLDLGPDFIKYGGTSHFSSPIMIGFSPRAQEVIVEETHKRNLIAETHSTSSEGLMISVLAGIDLIQHPEVLSTEMPDELINEIAERRIVGAMLSNTITGAAWERHLKKRKKDSKKVSDSEVNNRRRENLNKTSAELRAEIRASGEMMEIRRKNAVKLIVAGCIITIGTDNYLGAAPEFRRNKKYENQAFGIGSVIATEGLVELGMTPMEAIVAITRNGAIACKMLDKIGTLEVGKYADLVILEENPLNNISNIKKIHQVIRDGKIIDFETLPYERIFSSPGRGHAW
jgi:imidazolonepropionase-like amidohydrolase